MNLLGFFDLADLCRHYDQDLWGHQTRDGRSLRRALSWLLDHALGEGRWPGEQITGFDQARLVPLIRRGATALGEPGLMERLDDLEDVDAAADRAALLYPGPSPP